MPRPFQSSPGPKAERCVEPTGTAALSVQFQSSPGPKAERCAIKSTGVLVRRICFNPRPARRPSAADAIKQSHLLLAEFQSSPGPKAERCPAPAQPDQAGDPVSILARPEGRALPWTSAAMSPAISLFQSSPGPKAERCPHPPLDPPRHRLVSILARPEGRALPRAATGSATRSRRFNPRPARRPSAAAPKRQHLVAVRCFNPRPARRPSAACSGPGRSCRCPIRFNPRPARRPSAASQQPSRQPHPQPVSILARPEGRALPGQHRHGPVRQ